MAITVTNLGTGSNKVSTQISFTAANAAATGTVIVVGVCDGGTSSTNLPSDTQGNTYASIATTFNNSTGTASGFTTLYYAIVTTALTTSDSIRYTPTSSAGAAVTAFFLTGVSLVTPYQVASVNTGRGSSTAPLATTTVTQVMPGTCVVGVVGVNDPSTDTFTQDTTHATFTTPPVRVGTTGNPAASNWVIAGGSVVRTGTLETALIYGPTITTAKWGVVIAAFQPQLLTGVSGTGNVGTITAQHAGSGTLTGLQAVGFPSPSAIDYNFSTNSIPSGLTFTRSSNATYFDSTGTLQTASSNAARFDYDPSTLAWRGLLIEESRTNSVSNPRAEGATGTTFPTNWYQENWMGGAAATFVTGTESGIPYVDITLNATPTSNNEWWSFGTFGAIAASVGQIWTGTVYVSLSGGSTTNVSGFQLLFQQLDVSNTKLGNLVSSSFPINSGTLATNRVRFTTTLTAATTAKVNFMGRVNFTATGSPVNITVRIGAPQAELGDTVTSVILPPVSSPAATTRSADSVSNTSIGSWYNSTQSSVACEAIVTYSTVTSAAYPVMWQLDDGSNSNRLVSFLLLGSSLDVNVLDTDGSFDDLNLDVGNATANTVFRTAYSISRTRAAYTRDGNSVVSGTPTLFPPSGVVDLWLGSAQASGNFFNGYIRRFRYWAHTLPDAYLQFLSAGSTDTSATAQVGGVISGPSGTGAATSLTGGAFTRGSSATYIDSSGNNMVLVGSNVLRTDYSTASNLSITSIGSNTGKSVSSIVITLPAAVPAGCTIFVAIATAGSSVLVNIADSVGQTNWVGGNGAATANGTIILDWAWSATAMPASSTITVTRSGGGTFTGAVYAWYVTGLLTSASPLDTAQTNLGSGTTPSLTTGTLAQVAEYVIGALAVAGPGTETFTNDANYGVLPSYRTGTTGGSDITVDVGMRLVLSTSAVTYAPTLGTSENWAAYLATFKQTGWGRVLIEGASTNYIPNANTATPTNGFSVASSTAIAPLYSSATIWKITSRGDNTGFNYGAFTGIPITTLSVWTISAWVYLPVGYSDTGVIINFDQGPGTLQVDTSHWQTNNSLTGQWQRIYFTVLTNSIDTTMNIVLRPPSYPTTGGFFYTQCWQVEPGYLSSYIPTSGTAATRAADSGSPTGLDIIDKIITGVFGTSAVGTLQRQAILTGVSATGFAGLDIPSLSLAITGVSGSSAVGTALGSAQTDGTASIFGVQGFSAPQNWVRNPTGTGLVAGTLGSGGTAPTNWSIGGVNGLNYDISVGTTYSVAGVSIPTVRVRVYGTSTATSASNLVYESNGGIGGLVYNVTETQSIYVALVAGSLTNVQGGALAHWGQIVDSTSVVIADQQSAFTPTSTFTQYSQSNTMPSSGNAPFSWPYASILVYPASTSVAIDLTLDMGGGQLAALTSPIVPSIGADTGGITGVAGSGAATSPGTMEFSGVSSTASAQSLGSGAFTRGSSATYLDTAGIVQTVGNNVLRYQNGLPLIEAAATNAAFPSIPSSGWVLDNITTPTGVVGPDNLTSSIALVENTNATIAFRVRQSFTTISPTSPATVSVFVKASGRSWLRLIMQDTGDGAFVHAWFNLSTGAIGTVALSGVATSPTATITACTNGWYRCTVSCTRVGGTSGNITAFVQGTNADNTLSNAGTNGTTSIYVWGIQLEAGTAATSYIATTSGTVTRSADIVSTTGLEAIAPSPTGVTGTGQISTATSSITATGIGVFGTGTATSLGGGSFSRASSATYVDPAGNLISVGNNVLRYQSGVPLIEPSITNNLILTTQLQNWNWSAVTNTGFAAIAPDGNLTATLVTETTFNGEHFFSQTPLIAANVPYTFSVYAKNVNRQYCALQFYDNTSPGNTTEAVYDLVGGTVTSFLHAGTGNTIWGTGIQAIGNGWYRCWVSSTLTATANTNVLCRIRMMNTSTTSTTYIGSTSNQLYFWGAQLEQGTSAPTSFIYSAASATTRAADTVSTAGIPAVTETALAGISGVAAAGSAGITVACLDPILNLYHNSANTNRLLADPLSGTIIAASFTAPHNFILLEVDLLITK